MCPTTTFSEGDDLAPPRAVLTTRARHLGVDWHTCWDAIEVEAKARVGRPDRLQKVRTLGVDEHIVRPSRVGTIGP